MTVYTRNFTQTLTYWPPSGNAAGGGVTYGAPVQIKARWQDKADLVRSADGQEVASSAIVYVDRALADKGYLYRGISASANPLTVPGAREILARGSSPDLSGTVELLKVWMK